MVVEKEKYIEEIQELKQFLSNKTQEELNGILAYWEEIKARWEKRKREFWLKHWRNDFLKLLWYMEEHEDEIEFRYEYLEEMSDVEKKKFIEEYLFDDVLYSFDGDFADLCMYGSTCSYLSLKEGKLEIEKWMTVVFRKNEIWDEWAEAMVKCLKLKEWVCLDLYNNQIWAEWAKAIAKMELKDWVRLKLDNNQIWDEWAEAISHMELKEWVVFDLFDNQIWSEWAKAIAENMKLKEWVTLNLVSNGIWDEWAKAVSKMKLKEWVTLGLTYNGIWDEWAKAISQMELQEWVKIDLRWNKISRDMKEELKKWVESYKAKWIKCEVNI